MAETALEKRLPRTVLSAVQPYLAGQASNSLSVFLPLLPAHTIYSGTFPVVLTLQVKRCHGGAPPHQVTPVEGARLLPHTSMQAIKAVAP